MFKPCQWMTTLNVRFWLENISRPFGMMMLVWVVAEEPYTGILE